MSNKIVMGLLRGGKLSDIFFKSCIISVTLFVFLCPVQRDDKLSSIVVNKISFFMSLFIYFKNGIICLIYMNGKGVWILC